MATVIGLLGLGPAVAVATSRIRRRISAITRATSPGRRRLLPRGLRYRGRHRRLLRDPGVGREDRVGLLLDGARGLLGDSPDVVGASDERTRRVALLRGRLGHARRELLRSAGPRTFELLDPPSPARRRPCSSLPPACAHRPSPASTSLAPRACLLSPLICSLRRRSPSARAWRRDRYDRAALLAHRQPSVCCVTATHPGQRPSRAAPRPPPAPDTRAIPARRCAVRAAGSNGRCHASRLRRLGPSRASFASAIVRISALPCASDCTGWTPAQGGRPEMMRDCSVTRATP